MIDRFNIEQVLRKEGAVVNYKDHAAIVVELLGLIDRMTVRHISDVDYTRIAELRREYQGEKE